MHFIADQIRAEQRVVLLQVVDSTGSSPGRTGFRMAIALDSKTGQHTLLGSIGGGIMEQKLVMLAVTRLREGKNAALVKRQIHRKDAPNDQSGMICSGEQTIFFYTFKADDLPIIEQILTDLSRNTEGSFSLSKDGIAYASGVSDISDLTTSKKLSNLTNVENAENANAAESRVKHWKHGVYVEKLGFKNQLYIVGAGHCALALSRQMRLLGSFKIHLFDDRRDLNTFIENDAAHEKTVVDYAEMPNLIPESSHVYVVLMTVGYRSDEQILRGLAAKNFKYLGMLGSRTKVATMLENLENDGFSSDFLTKIHAPIGVDVKSQTPEEIAVSIAAEIIRVKNG
jgi:xanthine dehydrogenase accessory factor